jgi:LysM domain
VRAVLRSGTMRMRRRGAAAVLACFLTVGAARAACAPDEIDLLQLPEDARATAAQDAVTEICYPCGGPGELACGADGERICDAGLEVIAATGQISERLREPVGMALESVPAGEGWVDTVIGRLQFCVEPSRLADRPRPEPPDFALPEGLAPEAANRRTYLVFDEFGQGWAEGEGPGPGHALTRLVADRYHRVYVADFNGPGVRDASGEPLPPRILELGPDGRLAEVWRGVPLSGNGAPSFASMAEAVARVLPVLPHEGRFGLIGFGMGGYLAKQLAYGHYEDLAAAGMPIGEVVFLGHQHYAEGGSPAEMISGFCTGLSDGRFAAGPITARTDADFDLFPELSEGELSARCRAGLWLAGWQRQMVADLVQARQPRTLDDLDMPFVDWTSVGGITRWQEPGPDNLLPRATWTDGRTPLTSALGIDEFMLGFPRTLTWDRTLIRQCGHDLDCLLGGTLSELPQAPPRPGVPYRVQQGDSTWQIARRALDVPQGGSSPSVDPYWRRLMAANGLATNGSRGGIGVGDELIMPPR